MAADVLDLLRHLAVAAGRRALEHEMLEEMGDAGGAARLVGGAHPVPDHLRHHGGAVVGDDDELKAVGEPELAHPLRGVSAVYDHGDGHGGKAEAGNEQARSASERASKLIENRHHHGLSPGVGGPFAGPVCQGLAGAE